MLRNLQIKLPTFTATVIFSAMAAITAVLGVLAYQRVYDKIQEGFDHKMLAVSSVTSAFIDGDEHAEMMRLNAESSPLYLKYAGPMQRIMRTKNITYLYTLIPTGGDGIVYGLDGTIGPNHSTISATDTAPGGEAEGIVNVYEHGNAYLSGVRVWQQWGLLKTAYAPIYNRAGRITAMSGADIDITIIAQKTRVVLFSVVGCGLVLLAFAGFVSTRVARRVTGPLGRLKSAALQVAAGQYGLQADIRSPSELRDLAGSFNRLSLSLEQRLLDLRQVNASIEHGRREQLLHHALRRRDLTTSPSPSDCLRIVQLPNGHDCRDGSGWVRWHDQILFWAADLAETPLAAARARHDVALVLQPLLRRHAGDPAELALCLEPLFRDRVHAFLVVNLETGEALGLPRRGPGPRLDGEPAGLPAGRPQLLPGDRLFSWCPRPEIDRATAALLGAAGVDLDRAEASFATGAAGGHALLVLWQTGPQGRPSRVLRTLLEQNGMIESHFDGLTSHELDQLLSVAQRERCAPQHCLTLQGERSEQLQLVIVGQVKVATAGGSFELEGPHWIGEFSFLYGGVANATVTALSTLDCLIWDRAPLSALLQDHPELEHRFHVVLARAMSAKLTTPPFPA